MSGFNGLGMHLGNLSRLSKAKTRSICPENPTGGKGQAAMATEGTGAAAARDLGRGWKISPSIRIAPGETATIADIEGPGAIQHIWMTPTGNWRFTILRVFWDDSPIPSVEAPVGDFFASGWGEFAQVSALPICVNPGSAFNSYFEMPFRKRARITIENIADEPMTLYYQVNYTLTEVPDDAAYFHAHFRRANPIPYKTDYTVIDGIAGEGQFVGMYLAWGQNNNGWWGEGEVKFFIDGDDEFPTIATTGLEDYFGGILQFRPIAEARPGPGDLHHPLCRLPPGDPPEFRLPHPVSDGHVPVPCDGPGPLRTRPQDHGPGPRLGLQRTLPADAGRRRLRRLLVPDAAGAEAAAASGARVPARRLGIALVLAGAVDRREPAFAADDPAFLRRPEVARRIVEGAEHDLDLARRQMEETRPAVRDKNSARRRRASRHAP